MPNFKGFSESLSSSEAAAPAVSEGEQPEQLKESSIELQESEKEALVKAAESFSDLYDVIEKIGPVQGSQELFLPMRLIDIIAKVRRGEIGLGFVTNTYKIADQVEYLLGIESNTDTEPNPNDRGPKSPEPLSAKLETPQEEEQAVNIEADPAVSEGGPEAPIIGFPVPDYEWDTPGGLYNEWRGMEKYRGLTYNDTEGFYPKMGSNNLGTRQGRINGSMIYCDGETAIFQTPNGKMGVPFGDLISPSGKTYSEIQIEKELKENSRRLKAEEVWAKLHENKTVVLTSDQWKDFYNYYSADTNFLAENGFTLGQSNVRSKDGLIEGDLVWGNQDWAVFSNKTATNFSVIPFKDLIVDESILEAQRQAEQRRAEQRKNDQERKRRAGSNKAKYLNQ